MKRLDADSFAIGSTKGGRTAIVFKDKAGQEVEIGFPSIGIMGLAVALRQKAKEAPVPMILAKPARFRRIEGPPSHRSLATGRQPSPEAKEPPHISIGVTADLDAVWTLIASRNSDGTAMEAEFVLPLEDAEVIAKGFQEAITAIKHKPAATKH